MSTESNKQRLSAVLIRKLQFMLPLLMVLFAAFGMDFFLKQQGRVNRPLREL